MKMNEGFVCSVNISRFGQFYCFETKFHDLFIYLFIKSWMTWYVVWLNALMLIFTNCWWHLLVYFPRIINDIS